LRSRQPSAALFFSCAKTNREDRGEGSDHPNVKPTDPAWYLCRLVALLRGIVLDLSREREPGIAANTRGIRLRWRTTAPYGAGSTDAASSTDPSAGRTKAWSTRAGVIE
jgi:hypothetical protein